MKEACEEACRERVWMCAMEMVVHLFLLPVRLLLHVPHYILSSYTWYLSIFCHLLCCISLPSHFLSHTLSLSFCYNSKYPVGPGCRLLVLVYLALGSIRLQAEASHSSQSHKMWLVLTTALQGDELIGLIASDRLCWTLYRKTTATACCGFILAVFSFFFSFFLYCSPFAVFSLSSMSISFPLPLSILLPVSLHGIWLSSDCLSLNFISLFVCFIFKLAYMCTIYKAAFLSCKVMLKW